MNIAETLEAGQVTRYHANPQMNRLMQTDADHCWGVAAVMLSVYPDARKEVLLHALFHDAGERKSGDLPAPFKRSFPEIAEQHKAAEAEFCSQIVGHLPKISEFEKKLLKFADIAEALIYICNYAVRPQQVEGWNDAIGQLSGLASWLDANHEGSIQRYYEWCAENVSPLLHREGIPHDITPF